jgi:hypothetical protein
VLRNAARDLVDAKEEAALLLASYALDAIKERYPALHSMLHAHFVLRLL